MKSLHPKKPIGNKFKTPIKNTANICILNYYLCNFDIEYLYTIKTSKLILICIVSDRTMLQAKQYDNLLEHH